MNSIVVYGSRHGNTRKVAETIAGELRKRGPVEIVSAEKAPSTFPVETDLVVVGGPTEAHQVTEPVALFFNRLDEGALAGKAAAAFDTRLHAPAWLSGAAGVGIAKRLERAGAHVIAPALSIFVAGKLPELVPGELERAAGWADSLANLVQAKQPVLAGR